MIIVFQKHTVLLRIGFVILILVLLLTSTQALAQDPSQAISAAQLEQLALQLVSSRYGISLGSLATVNSAVAEYPLQGASAYEFKIMNSQTGEVYGIAMDKQGRELDTVKLIAAEEAAYFDRYGRFEPELAELLENAPANKPIEVLVWLEEPEYIGVDRPAIEKESEEVPGKQDNEKEQQAAIAAQDAYFAQVDAHRAAFVQGIVAPVIARLESLGFAASADSFAPVVYASLTPDALKEVGSWKEVDLIYLSRTMKPDLEVARATIHATTVHSRGFTGADVKVAQIEVGKSVGSVQKGVRVATNPYLTGVVQDTTYACSSPGGHETAVAGIIRSTHNKRRGIAPNVTLRAGGSCTGKDAQLQNRSTAAADWGARVLNLSWGENITSLVPGANDRFYDTMVINRYRTVVKSAGNEAGSCNSGTGNVTSPGLAYNVITVGNFNDKNTNTWLLDGMDSCSSWRDPASTHSDREKPEIAAPGTNINSTTTASPWTGGVGSGTSYAAPMITGVSALLINRDSNLSAWPEAIKAILMASAIHDIEGANRLSEKDGAGAVVADRADDIARGYKGNWGAQFYDCGADSYIDVTSMNLAANVRTRVVIAWDNDPAYSSYASQPGADLDLSIVNSAGTTVAQSWSWDNTYEIVDFKPSATGAYTLRVYKFYCYYSPRWLGWAWMKK
ncbi:MAG: S8 family peptidase [Anaerolineales bacterium]|nr:S8 family peptidase [Anaerolineales bacterium]